MRAALATLALAAWSVLGATPAAAQTEIKKDDHIALIGNTLADRMQHDGWLETYLQAAYPSHDLVIRNLGFSGDQVHHRPRAHKEYGDPHTHLGRVKADVIFAFFGYNESFDNKPDEYKARLISWIDETKGKNYSGKGAPRIVLFSPIMHEDLKDPNLPDGTENNRRLEAYAKATADAAKEKGVGYVDLYAASKAAYARSAKPLTINGVHLNGDGNREIAKAIVEKLAGRLPRMDDARLEKIRKAVLDKNWCWHNRYRATDGNDVWGGRSKLHGNRAVLQHELKMLDVMTANRDKAVWAAVKGRAHRVSDSNVPKPLEVKTNYKPSGKTGTTEFISGEAGIAKMKLADGLEAKLFADEKMFKQMINPVQLGVDPKGRLWAAVWPTYPKWEPLKEMNDALVILPDENRDGRADACIVFAKVHNPTGFTFWNGGVIVVSAPDILFLKDTDGDDRADVRYVIMSGIDSADTHHTANNLYYGPDGYIYYQRGVFHKSNVETPWQKTQEDGASAMYRFNPRTHKFKYHAKNSPNPHGISFDYWGYHYATDGTGGRAYQVREDGKGGFAMRGLLKKKVRPVPSSGILSSEHFPERNQGNFLICNAIGFLGIKQYRLEFNNGDANGVEIEDLLVSDDRNFRPTDFEIPDDGALYVSDWSNPLIGHMQHNIRDPMRDHEHGRIYRITVKGRPLQKSVRVHGQPIDKLLDLLKHPVNNVRLRVHVELSGRPTKDVIAAVQKWAGQWDASKKEHAHHLLEALWIHQQHNVKNEALLAKVLESPEEHARIAAARVKYMWDHGY